ncbi:MAG: hypothetical protein QXS37_04890 [Candidatus Aenigmatarchaeota archaeon]
MPKIDKYSVENILAKEYRNIVSEKEIKSKIVGKRLVSIIRKLVKEKNRKPQDLMAIFHSLGINETFEITWLFNDDYYSEKLKNAKDHLSRGLVNQERKSYKELMLYFVSNFISPFTLDIEQGKTIYIDLLTSVPLSVEGAVEWVAVDIPFNLCTQFKVINRPSIWYAPQIEELNSIVRKRTLFIRLQTYYFEILKSNFIIYKVVKDATSQVLDYVKYNGDMRTDVKLERFSKKYRLDKLEELYEQ